MEEDEYAKTRARIAELRVEHRDLDDVIAQMTQSVYADQLHLSRLKRRKLLVKDTITRLESLLIPDLGA